MSLKRIAVFIDNYNIDYSPSIINLLDFLSASCLIDLFFQNVPMKNNPVLGKKNIHLIWIRPHFHWRGALASARQRLANGMKGHFRDAFLPAHAAAAVARRLASLDYHCHLAFDASGMVLCKKLFPTARPFYYSLELALLSEAAGGGEDETGRSFLEKARSWSHDIRGLIIQSKERESLFRIDYPLAESAPVLYLPITYQGPALVERKDLLRQKYKIPPQARIAIHLGGANPYFSSLEIAEVFAKITGWVLFFQGNHLRGFGEEIRRLAKRMGANNIVVAKKFYTRLDKVDRVLQSADVGIAWYNDRNANFRTAGFSSGKISAYLRCGLPILANDLPSLQARIAQVGCGVCVQRVEQIPEALQHIEMNHKDFRKEALREYDHRYRFENYIPALRFFFNL